MDPFRPDPVIRSIPINLRTEIVGMFNHLETKTRKGRPLTFLDVICPPPSSGEPLVSAVLVVCNA